MVSLKRSVRFLILLGLACRQDPALAPGTSTAANPIRQAIATAARKPLVRVQLRLAASGPAPPEDMNARRTVEERIERERIGTILDEAGGPGFIDFTVQVDDTVRAIPRIQALLRDAGIAGRSSIQVKSGTDK
jgi:hypothetical protein